MALVVTISDCRAAGYCVSGIRRHCEALGIDFRRLVREGVPASELEHLNDVLVQRCVNTAKQREAENGQERQA